MKELLRALGVTHVASNRQYQLKLQERFTKGITDIELHSSRLHIIIEAKKTGWATIGQLKRYANELSNSKYSGHRILCSLGVPPISASPARRWSPGNGITLKHLRWIDILRMVLEVQKRDGSTLLGEYARLIQEIIGMQSYDREVLVRDVTWGSGSFDSFFKHRLYRCKVKEIAEPLFFAPCFAGNVERIHKGIHYFSRVYYRTTFAFGDRNAVREALDEANSVIENKVKVLKNKKSGKDEIEYLKSLHALWTKGVSACKDLKQEHAVFFLGDPIPLPKPVFKKGFMIPSGFSMSLEQLMNGREAQFKC